MSVTAMGERQRVVLVGGGVSALEAYALLAQRRRRAIRQGRLEIVVVSPHETLRLASSAVPLWLAMPGAAVIPAVVIDVDRTRRVVTYVRSGAAGSGSVERLRFDELVVDPAHPEPGLEDLMAPTTGTTPTAAAWSLAPGVWAAGAGLGQQLLRALAGLPSDVSPGMPSGAASSPAPAARSTGSVWDRISARRAFRVGRDTGARVGPAPAIPQPLRPVEVSPLAQPATATRYAAVTTRRRPAVRVPRPASVPMAA